MRTFVFTKVVGAVFASMLVTSLIAAPVMGQQVLSDDKKKAVATDDADKKEETFKADAPREEVSGTSGKEYLLYGGAMALALGGIAAAAGGGGGGGGGDSDVPQCQLEPVGPLVNGSDWVGVLRTINFGPQPITAIVSQCGRNIAIQTTSTLPYGQNFLGTMDSRGNVVLKEQRTNETWTSLFGPARARVMNVYDYVNDLTVYDSLELTRVAPAP